MSTDLGEWSGVVYFENFINTDPSIETSYPKANSTFMVSASGDSLIVEGKHVSFDISASKRRAWAWSPDEQFFAYVSSPNGPDWYLSIVALQDIRRTDCSILMKGSIAARTNGLFAGRDTMTWWNNANFAWAGSKAVIAASDQLGGSELLRSIVCPIAATPNVWSEGPLPDTSGKIGWVYLVSPSGLSVALAPKKLNSAAPPYNFLLVSTANAKQVQFTQNGSMYTVSSTGANPSITTLNHAENGVRINRGNGVDIIDVDDPDIYLGLGLCKVSPLNFSDVILNGPEERSSKLVSSIKNESVDGCLQISEIKSIPPFTVIKPFPVFISPNKDASLEVLFKPEAVGKDQHAELPITTVWAKAESDKFISCTGSARNSLAQCAISGPNKNLEVVIGAATNTAQCIYEIKNIGDDTLKVNAVSDKPPFFIVKPLPDCNRLLGHNDKTTLTVEFRPDSVGKVMCELAVDCTPSNGETTLKCEGSARLPIIGLIAEPPETFTTYRNRRKRVTVTLKNTGEAPLTMTITGTPADSFVCPSSPTIQPNTTQTIDVIVWNGTLGQFVISLNIQGSYQCKVGNSIVSDSTSCEVKIEGVIVAMPPDYLEPNDDFATARRIDLPMPKVWDPVRAGYHNLSLDDHNSTGTDDDFFLVSFLCSSQDDNCMSTSPSVNKLGMGVVMKYFPPVFSIRTQLKPELQEDGRSFTVSLNIFGSDTYNRYPMSAVSGAISIPCPSRTFPDKKFYVKLDNPDFNSQGPIEYDIQFEYQPSMVLATYGGQFTSVKFLKLKKYYERIWLGDPPSDLYGNIIHEEAWFKGAQAVIVDVNLFIERHLAFINQPEILSFLKKELNLSGSSIIAQEHLILARISRDAGLFREAEYHYKESADNFTKAECKEQKLDALRGLMAFYAENHLMTESLQVERNLAKLLRRS